MKIGRISLQLQKKDLEIVLSFRVHRLAYKMFHNLRL